MSAAVPRPAKRVANNNPSAGPPKRLSPHDRALALRKEQQMRVGLESGSNSTEYEYIIVEEEVEEDDDDAQPEIARPVARPAVAGLGVIVTQVDSSSDEEGSSDTSYLYEEDEETEFTPSEQPAFLQMIGASPLSQSLEATHPARKGKPMLSPHVHSGARLDGAWSNADAAPNMSIESFQRSGSNLTGWTGAHFLTPHNSGDKNDLDQFDRLQRGTGTHPNGSNRNGETSPSAADVVRGLTPQRRTTIPGMKRVPLGHAKPTDAVPLTDALLNPLRHKTERDVPGGGGGRRAAHSGGPAKAQPSSPAGPSPGQPSGAAPATHNQCTAPAVAAAPTPATTTTTTPTPAVASAPTGPPGSRPVSGDHTTGNAVKTQPRKVSPVAAASETGTATTASPATGAGRWGEVGTKPPNRALQRTSPGLSPEAQAKITISVGANTTATAMAAGKEATARAKPSGAPTNGGTAAATTAVRTSPITPASRPTLTTTVIHTAAGPAAAASGTTPSATHKVVQLPSPAAKMTAAATTNSSAKAHPSGENTASTASSTPATTFAKAPPMTSKLAVAAKAAAFHVAPKPATTTATAATAGAAPSPKPDDGPAGPKKPATSASPPSTNEPVVRALRNSVPPAAGVRSSGVVSSTASRPLAGASNTTLPPGVTATDTPDSDPSSSLSANTPTKAWRAHANMPPSRGFGSESSNSNNETVAAHSSQGTTGDAGLAPRRKRTASNRPPHIQMTNLDMTAAKKHGEVDTSEAGKKPTTAPVNIPTPAAPVTGTASPKPLSPTEKRLSVAMVSTNTKVPNKPPLQHPGRSEPTTTAAATAANTTAPAASSKPEAVDDRAAANAKQKLEEALQKKREELMAKMKSSTPEARDTTTSVGNPVPASANKPISKPTTTPRGGGGPTVAPPRKPDTAIGTAAPAESAVPNPASQPFSVTKRPSTTTTSPAGTATPAAAPLRQTPSHPSPTTSNTSETHPSTTTTSTHASPTTRTLARTMAGTSQTCSPASMPLRQVSAVTATPTTNSNVYSRVGSADSAVAGSTVKTPRTVDAGSHKGPGPLPLPLPPSGQRGYAAAGTQNNNNGSNSNNMANAVATPAVPSHSGPPPLTAVAAATIPSTTPTTAAEARTRSPAKRCRRRSSNSAGARHGSADGRASLMTSQILFDPNTTNDHTSQSEQNDSGTREGSSRPHRYKRSKRKQQQLRMTEIPALAAALLAPSAQPAATTAAAQSSRKASCADNNNNSSNNNNALPTREAAAASDHDYQRVVSGTADPAPPTLKGATLKPSAAAAPSSPRTAHARSTAAATQTVAAAANQNASAGEAKASNGITSDRQPFLSRFAPAERTQAAPYRQAVLYFNQGIDAQIKAMEECQQIEECEQERHAASGGRRRHSADHTPASPDHANTLPSMTEDSTRARPQSTLPHSKPVSHTVASQSMCEADVGSSPPPTLRGLGGLDGGVAAENRVGVMFSSEASPRPGVRHSAHPRTTPSSAGLNASPRASSYADEGRFGNSGRDNAGGPIDGGGAGSGRAAGTGRSSLPQTLTHMSDVDKYAPAPSTRASDRRRPRVSRAETTPMMSNEESITLPPVHRRSTTRPVSNLHGSDFNSHRSSSIGAGMSGDVHRHRRRVSLLNDGNEVMLMEDVSDVDNSVDNTPSDPSSRQRMLSNGRRRSGRAV